ncbi:hypothetical protein [Solirubrobacter soli]|uniref:hypothetical protein n=1 Tax=Solirubrobacter soli TaxID=363832 RepID=UPI0003FAD16C|nr:hypothetical protein [Solirubrobacter soli]
MTYRAIVIVLPAAREDGLQIHAAAAGAVFVGEPWHVMPVNVEDCERGDGGPHAQWGLAPEFDTLGVLDQHPEL